MASLCPQKDPLSSELSLHQKTRYAPLDKHTASYARTVSPLNVSQGVIECHNVCHKVLAVNLKTSYSDRSELSLHHSLHLLSHTHSLLLVFAEHFQHALSHGEATENINAGYKHRDKTKEANPAALANLQQCSDNNNP